MGSTSDIKKLFNQQEELMDKIRRGPSILINTTADRKTKAFFKSKFAAAEKALSTFQSNHLLIIGETTTEERKALAYFTENIDEKMENYHIDYLNALTQAYTRIHPDINFEDGNFANSSMYFGENSNLSSKEPSLPTVNIPSFSGAFTEWRTFHDLFKTMIHDNTRLAASHKFQYLRGVVAGEAAEIIAEFDLTNDDYPKAWKALEDKYTDSSQMFMYVMDKFSSQPKIAAENPELLKDMMKTTKTCVKSLEDLKFERKHFESIIAYLILQKLPAETVAYWESTRTKKALPTIETISNCIDVRVRMSTAILKHQPSSTVTENKAKSTKDNFVKKKGNFKTYHVSNPTSSSTNNDGATGKFKCHACGGEGHALRKCPKFVTASCCERIKLIEAYNYCSNCLAYDHQLPKCKSPRNCGLCGERHNTLLHTSNAMLETSTAANHSSSSSNHNSGRNVHVAQHVTPFQPILLATAMVKVRAVDGAFHTLRAFIDQGSEASFISESATQLLRLPKTSIHASINGFGGVTSQQSKHMSSLEIASHHDQRFSLTLQAFVMGKLTNFLPSKTIQFHDWSHISGLSLADPTYYQSNQIDLLLGSDVINNILMHGVRKGPPGSPIAQETSLGWILSGPIATTTQSTIHLSAFHVRMDIDQLMEKFYQIEQVAETYAMSKEERWCEDHFQRTHRRMTDGRFSTRLPLRTLFDSNAVLGKSRDIAVSRFLMLERRFQRDPKLKEAYSKCINEYLELNHMQLATTTEAECKRMSSYSSFYLPHHAVLKESSTSTKLRVVFDGSRKTGSGKSLNDILVAGPTIQADLVSILINWRFHKVAFIADVKMMYRQVLVDERDIDYQRILYRNDPSEPIKDYCMNRLTFGTSSAAFVAIRTLQETAKCGKITYPEAANIIINDAYVDDVISGTDTDAEAIQLRHELMQLVGAGGFELKKWASNSNPVLQQIPEDEREVKCPLELNSDESIKTLGIHWNAASDMFGFKSTLGNIRPPHTKRSSFSTIAKLFDPVGLVSPVIVIAKIFMRRIWTANIEWDEEISGELLDDWNKYLHELSSIVDIKIQRWINTRKSIVSLQLHGFCDASGNAYGAAIYIRAVDSNGETHVHLISSKSRVAPVKNVTIPRLELCGAVLLSNHIDNVRKGIRFSSIEASDIFLWTDSEIVISWLRNTTRRWKIFVANRIDSIQEITKGSTWRHVGTADNPADLVSRGAYPCELVDNNLWWHGPSWLSKSSEQWPMHRIGVVNLPTEEEKRDIEVNIVQHSMDMIHQFSSLNRLYRVTAWCRRFIKNCVQQTKVCTKHLTIEEIEESTLFCIREVQQHCFPMEFKALLKARQCNLPFGQAQFESNSKLLKLSPILDENNLICISGRLAASFLTYREQHPIILPSNHHFTSLIIDSIHRRTLHGGTQLTLAMIRKQFWILRARAVVGHHIHKCITCHRLKAATATQLMGNLPAPRVRPSRAFLHTGIDFAGPINIRTSKGRGHKSYKGYIAVFVCLCVKAIHLEAVSDLTSDAFIAAFHRFTSMHGRPSDIYTDNGTNFVGASNQLEVEKQIFVKTIERELVHEINNDGIKWHFIPPAAPHFGGLWEAGVKSVKHHLRRIVGNSTLTFEEMTTVLYRISACLNSRPLCPFSADPDDFTALTPGHFMIGDALLSVPERSLLETNVNRLNRWQLLTHMFQSFWQRWHSEYLTRMQERPKWLRQSTNFEINDMVLIKDERLPPLQWLLARVIDLHPGPDNIVRVVTLRTKNGIFKRPITKLCRLPIEKHTSMNETSEDTAIEENNTSA